MINTHSHIFVPGALGFVGQSVINKLKQCGYTNITTSDKKSLDLTSQRDVRNFFDQIKHIDMVIMAAGQKGSIIDMKQKAAEMLWNNLQMQLNVIDCCNTQETQIILIGSAAIYPAGCGLPQHEEDLLNGKCDESLEYYALSKIIGIKMVNIFRAQKKLKGITFNPPNLYGEKDNYGEGSNVIASLLSKFIIAKRNNLKQIKIWGSGNQIRDFLHVDVFADALVKLLDKIEAITTQYPDGHINIGSGVPYSIKNVVDILKAITAYDGEIIYDTTMPSGVDKYFCIDRFKSVYPNFCIPDLSVGLQETYQNIIKNNVI